MTDLDAGKENECRLRPYKALLQKVKTNLEIVPRNTIFEKTGAKILPKTLSVFKVARCLCDDDL